ncbi:MAG: hypothetical protein QOJ65_860 [Fimbriimonadaceae bacterium]|jgi:ABC-type Co2+ transport system permease subunit|nr:hypothetical protein [Fimbriimonadaceae bacterium]
MSPFFIAGVVVVAIAVMLDAANLNMGWHTYWGRSNFSPVLVLPAVGYGLAALAFWGPTRQALLATLCGFVVHLFCGLYFPLLKFRKHGYAGEDAAAVEPSRDEGDA